MLIVSKFPLIRQNHNGVIENQTIDHIHRHDPNYDLEEWIKKNPRFVLLRAEEKYTKNPNRKVTGLHLFFTFVGTLLKTYLKTKVDGKIGVIIAYKTAINRTMAKLILYEKFHIRFSVKKTEDMNKTKYLG